MAQIYKYYKVYLCYTFRSIQSAGLNSYVTQKAAACERATHGDPCHASYILSLPCHHGTPVMLYHCHVTWSHYVWACVIPRLLDQAMSGVSKEEARWRTCVSRTHGTFALAVGRMFVDNYFDKTAKLTVSSVRCVNTTTLYSNVDSWSCGSFYVQNDNNTNCKSSIALVYLARWSSEEQ